MPNKAETGSFDEIASDQGFMVLDGAWQGQRVSELPGHFSQSSCTGPDPLLSTGKEDFGSLRALRASRFSSARSFRFCSFNLLR